MSLLGKQKIQATGILSQWLSLFQSNTQSEGHLGGLRRDVPRTVKLFMAGKNMLTFEKLVYPIWWGIAAWPMNGFVSANDFTGKTVIPFCTSASSGIGESGTNLQELAGTGSWMEGMRFRSNASEETVREWVSGLGL